MNQQYEELRQALTSLLTTGTIPPDVLERHGIAPNPFANSPDLDALKHRYLTPQPMRDADFQRQARADVLRLVAECAKLRHFYKTHRAVVLGMVSPDELERVDAQLSQWLMQPRTEAGA